jgi:arginyl-tRNA synthetase
MKIRDIERRLVELRDGVLADQFDVPDETLDELDFVPPPEPEMGDLGFPCFQLAPILKTQPPEIAGQVADAFGDAAADLDLVESVEATGPYVNVVLAPGRVAEIVVGEARDDQPFGAGEAAGETDRPWMIEFSAPNTNKPQHLGHVRNNLLGESVASLVDFAGGDIIRTNLINDRGIHICKSMVAYELDDDASTPEEAGQKGDHFVGDYYVKFNDLVAEEYETWQETDEADQEFQAWHEDEQRAGRLPDDLGQQREQVRESFFETFEEDFFNEYSDLGARAREMLQLWEEGDEEVRELWETMNGWVLDGFEETYERLGIEFDEIDFESDTYERGRDVVEQGLEQGLFERLDDGAVAFDLDHIGMDGQKVLLRSDGTTVYMTQDLGTAHRRFDEHDLGRMIYVVGDEQEYHFQVLFGILQQLDERFADRLHHLSYGMVDLPEGKMKSREGKVVDADDLMDEMTELAEEAVRERYDNLSGDEIARRAGLIGQAALKYYILDFNPRTNVQFNPEESISFQGRTGPYCLYSYARIQSIARRLGGWPDLDDDQRREALRALGTDREMEVVRSLQDWPETIESAYDDLDPSDVTEHLFELAKSFSSLYNDPDHRIVDLEGPRRDGLLVLARAVGDTLQTGLELLGIETLDEM